MPNIMQRTMFWRLSNFNQFVREIRALQAGSVQDMIDLKYIWKIKNLVAVGMAKGVKDWVKHAPNSCFFPNRFFDASCKSK